jgi:hypothetical protein
MAVAVKKTDLYIHNLRARMPFRYGIAEMTVMPHLFVFAKCRIDGICQVGISADNLAPKWFTKNPHTTYQQDILEIIQVINSACRFAEQVGESASVFDLWLSVYSLQMDWAVNEGYPPLLWNFGVSLIERAVMDAFCRSKEIRFSLALQQNLFGIRLGELHPQLARYEPVDFLPYQPLEKIFVRQTIGLSDPLTEDDIAPEDRLHDGLPQSLEAVIRTYNLSYFKIKISGNGFGDIYRLKEIAKLIERLAVSDFAFTLDGNEQFKSVTSLRLFWETLSQDSVLANFIEHMLFVEQPINRDMALTQETRRALLTWDGRPPMIIDESDSQLKSLPIALACGYQGTSHKNCKGVFKGIANACLLVQSARSDPNRVFILSGEDLINIGPVSLLQDLAVMACLGIRHVERNGHYYFTGLSMFPEELQEKVLLSYPDLYQDHQRGFATLKISSGAISIDSVIQSPFGPQFQLDASWFTPLEDWRFESLISYPS